VRASRQSVAALRGTRVVVIARSRVVEIETPQIWVTGIVGTQIGIVAAQQRAADTATKGARIRARADIAVVTSRDVIGKDATDPGIARIVRTAIRVITEERRPTRASSEGTGIARRTEIAIVTGGNIVREDAANPGIT